jgi:hypothetical protein
MDTPRNAAAAEAVEALARHLHWTMERFDPSDDERESEWDTLTEPEREFYRSCVREFLLERRLVLAALG